jgi:hypothetical protein
VLAAAVVVDAEPIFQVKQVLQVEREIFQQPHHHKVIMEGLQHFQDLAPYMVLVVEGVLERSVVLDHLELVVQVEQVSLQLFQDYQ